MFTMGTGVYTLVSLIVILKLCGSLYIDGERMHFGLRIKTSTDGSTRTYTFEWMTKVSSSDCLKACKSTKACQFINYHIRSQTCLLIRYSYRIRIHVYYRIIEEVEQTPGYIFGKKSEWTMTNLADCDMCAYYGQCTTIGDTQTTTTTTTSSSNINTNSSRSNVCRNSGCEFPHFAEFQGNMFSAGSWIRNSTNVSFLCTLNGIWYRMPYCRGSHYYINTELLSWFEAQARCMRFSGHLANIEKEEEEAFLRGYLGGNTWIGLNDLDNEGMFVWSDGSALRYSNWRSGEPNNLYGEDCVSISWGPWVDRSCDAKLPHICEFP